MNATTPHRLCLLIAATVLLAGCGADVEVPKPVSSETITTVLERQLDVVEKACDAGEVTAEQLSAVSMSLAYLRGHLENEKKASPEQLDALDRAHARLSDLRRSGRASPEQVKAIIAEIRSVLATLGNTPAGG